jgi:homoserine O-acetyltransferase
LRISKWLAGTALFTALGLISSLAFAGEYPAPKESDWVAHDFKFHDGAILPELKLHYTTIGNPSGQPVLILHGTMGSGASLLTPAFAGELFGPGQPLDASKYFIILPDSIGAGKSSKPSDGLRAKFPDYDYDDMVKADYQLLTEGLKIPHLRLVLGYSMGGMETWIWGEAYPDSADALVPMAATPAAMSGRNWMLRRLLIESIKRDPDWNGGNYTAQPHAMPLASLLFNDATAGGTQAYQSLGPTREAADKFVDAQLAVPFKPDANDFIRQWNASRNYDPSAGLEKIKAPLLVINSGDDERNPIELGIMETNMKRVPNGHVYIIPASAQTRGHATNVFAKFWAKQLGDFLQTVP